MSGRLTGLVLTVLAAGIGLLWWQLPAQDSLAGFVRGNGRIEAVEIDIAATTGGRVEEILFEEGDFVAAGAVLARMDTATLAAQLREAQAQMQRAHIGVRTANSQVMQRQAEIDAARAVVAQREAESRAAQKQFERTRDLAKQRTSTQQALDEDLARLQGARAAVSAARAQVSAAEAAHSMAQAQVVAAEATVEATQATVQRIEAELDDSVLRSPRDGRIQYRVAQPGEVVPPGGVVLNMVVLTDVYMAYFLPTEEAGRIGLGSEVRLVLDAAPQYVIPARVTFVADVAQFTPKSVETRDERQKLMFRVKARIDPALLREHLEQVKTGLPGTAYMRLDRQLEWPPELQVRLPG